MRSLTRSNQHFKNAAGRLPLGVASNFRYWGDDKTIYVKRGKGGRLWDIDDNEYIDYRLGYGPAILGYADPRVDEAAREGMEVGGVFALANIKSYGEQLRQGLGKILSDRDFPHSFVGHPALSGLFYSAMPPSDYRDWINTDYEFYDTMAPELHDLEILVEPDSREPWFLCEAHDVKCLNETLDKFGRAVDITLDKMAAKQVPVNAA